jgi:uncharacterized protein
MKIVVFGANGRVGQRIVAEALTRGHEVTAAVREPLAFAGERRARVVAADVVDPASVRVTAVDHDVAVSAVGPAWGGDPKILVDAAHALVSGMRTAAVPRLLVVGGAGSLEASPGVRLVDTPGFPDELKPLAYGHAEALEVFRTEAGDINWTVISPPPGLHPGERTGTYRTETDSLLVDGSGKSQITVDDFAVAIMDEVERPRFVRQRFTVAQGG